MTISTKYGVRSISLPSRSHPSLIKFEEELDKFKLHESKSFPASSNSKLLCNDLYRLAQLYKCIDTFLNLPSTHETLSLHKNEKWVSAIIDGSLRHLDVCNVARDTVGMMKDRVRDVQSSLRRSKGGNFIKLSIRDSLKGVKKDMVKTIALLKVTENMFEDAAILFKDDHGVSQLVRVFREANLSTVSTFKSFASFLSKSDSNSKTTGRWSGLSNLLHREKVACEQKLHENANELENIEAALHGLSKGGGEATKMINCTNEKLRALEVSLEGIENGFEWLFKGLIRTRVSLLNILSH